MYVRELPIALATWTSTGVEEVLADIATTHPRITVLLHIRLRGPARDPTAAAVIDAIAAEAAVVANTHHRVTAEHLIVEPTLRSL